MAQTSDDPWWLSIDVVSNKFYWNGFDGRYDFGSLDNAGIRVGVQRYLSKSFDLSLAASRGRLTHENIFESNVTDIDLSFRYKFNNGYILKENSVIAPFLSIGAGLSNFSDIEGFNFGWNGTFTTIPIGLGVKVNVAEGASVTLSALQKIKNRPDYTQYGFGVNFSLGRNKDSDGDGIRDKDDPCPQVAGPVDNQGCPYPDDDNDGVINSQDQCPQVAGTLNGCPDSDGDGIADKDDACPQVAGISRFNGCPDSDGDGIKDSEDECPQVAGTLNGCPDRDGDGIKDSEDACPTVAGTAATNGCPDADGDGIKDSDDQCPQTAGVAENNGCPVVKEEVIEALELAVKNIQFNSNSDVLKRSSYESLDQVANLMQENETFNLKLSGHTDNTGRAEYNLELSKRRAAAVKQYLIDQGVASDRLEADGYGITQPIADNSTAAGRAQNRRVDLEIVFK